MTTNQILIGIGLILVLAVGARCPWLNPWMAGRSGRWVSRLAHGLEVLERNWPACGVCAAVGAAIRRCLRPVMNARP